MRRKDREVEDRKEILSILDSCSVCRLAFIDGDEPYIVPVNFGWKDENGELRIYVHGANEGRKIDLVKRGGKVAFEADTGFEVIPAGAACSFSAKYRSVTGYGIARLAESAEEKLEGLSAVMEHLTGKSDWSFEPEKADQTEVIILKVEKISGKQRL